MTWALWKNLMSLCSKSFWRMIICDVAESNERTFLDLNGSKLTSSPLLSHYILEISNDFFLHFFHSKWLTVAPPAPSPSLFMLFFLVSIWYQLERKRRRRNSSFPPFPSFLFLTKTDQMLKSDPSPMLTTTTNLITCTTNYVL